LIDNVYSSTNYLGYSGTDASGVVVRDSTFEHNGAGIVASSGTFVYNNIVRSNNYTTVPAAGISETTGIPFGTGIWLPGVRNATVMNNVVGDHDRYGILVSRSMGEDALPENNQVLTNSVRDSGRFDLAWDGYGADDCFSGNDVEGNTGPPDLQTTYACDNRPFEGTPYPPVQSDVEASTSPIPNREQDEPPEPNRPRCQTGAQGCRR
jgi:hypothetical protein